MMESFDFFGAGFLKEAVEFNLRE